MIILLSNNKKLIIPLLFIIGIAFWFYFVYVLAFLILCNALFCYRYFDECIMIYRLFFRYVNKNTHEILLTSFQKIDFYLHTKLESLYMDCKIHKIRSYIRKTFCPDQEDIEIEFPKSKNIDILKIRKINIE